MTKSRPTPKANRLDRTPTSSIKKQLKNNLSKHTPSSKKRNLGVMKRFECGKWRRERSDSNGKKNPKVEDDKKENKQRLYYCPLCPNEPPYAGASGLWYHNKKHHGATTRPYKSRRDSKPSTSQVCKKKRRKEKKNRTPRVQKTRKQDEPTPLKEHRSPDSVSFNYRYENNSEVNSEVKQKQLGYREVGHQQNIGWNLNVTNMKLPCARKLDNSPLSFDKHRVLTPRKMRMLNESGNNPVLLLALVALNSN